MNYDIGVISNNLYQVYEVQTAQIISCFERLCDAKMEARRLNSGGGFDGFTPSFVLRPVKKITNNLKNVE